MFVNARWLPIQIAALALLTACATSGKQSAQPVELNDTLVTASWLAEHLNDRNLVVLDCSVLVEQDEKGGFRTVSGRDAYKKGHIPSAAFADLTKDLADGDSNLKFALPSPEQFAAAMGALGVGDDSTVVLYDRNNSVWAARVWWMLRWAGFDRAALLDGGLDAWTSEGQPLSTKPARAQARVLTPAVRPGLIADRDEVRNAIGSSGVSLVDALPAAHYRGEMVMYERPGHIPGASNVPAYSLLEETGHYREQNELAALLQGDRDARTINYCGGGIAASSNAFIMHRLGFTDVAVYMGSLQEWAADPSNPMQTGNP